MLEVLCGSGVATLARERTRPLSNSALFKKSIFKLIYQILMLTSLNFQFNILNMCGISIVSMEVQ